LHEDNPKDNSNAKYLVYSIVILIISITFLSFSFWMYMTRIRDNQVVEDNPDIFVCADCAREDEVDDESYPLPPYDDADLEEDYDEPPAWGAATITMLPLAEIQPDDLVHFMGEFWSEPYYSYVEMEAIVTDVPVRDFRLIELALDDYDDYYKVGIFLYLDTLYPDNPVIAPVLFDDFPYRIGISFMDTDGTFRAYALEYDPTDSGDSFVVLLAIYDIEDREPQFVAELPEAPPETPPETPPPPEPPQELFRVRSSWADAGSQRGAFADLNNAIAACPPGYSVFNNAGEVVFTNPTNSE